MFKYLQRLPFLKKNIYLGKAINEEVKITNSGWIANLKYIIDSYGSSNLMINIFEVLEGDISKKNYKNKTYFKKELKTVLFRKISLLTPPKR